MKPSANSSNDVAEAALPLGDRGVEQVPETVVVGHRDAGEDDRVCRELLTVVGAERPVTGCVDETPVGDKRIAFDWAAGATSRECGGEAAVDRGRCGGELLAEGLFGVDDPVKCHGAEAAREAFGVAEPDEGAVGESVVGDRVATECEPDGLDVHDRLGRTDVLQERAVGCRAGGGIVAAARSRTSRPVGSVGARSTVRNVSASWSPQSSGSVRPTPAGPRRRGRTGG